MTQRESKVSLHPSPRQCSRDGQDFKGTCLPQHRVDNVRRDDESGTSCLHARRHPGLTFNGGSLCRACQACSTKQ